MMLIFITFTTHIYAGHVISKVEKSGTQLPSKRQGHQLLFSTQYIPQDATVTVVCGFSKGAKANKPIYITAAEDYLGEIYYATYPDADTPLEPTGSKIYISNNDDYCSRILITRVKQSHQNIVFDLTAAPNQVITCKY